MSTARQPQTMVRQTPQSKPQTPPDEVLLGRYRVLARRGTGGFGAVCTCWDTRLQRRVAIKRMPLASTAELRGMSASTVEEALSEARTACLLAHPNIVTVFDFETDGDYAYLVMEYVDGLNLQELLSRVEGGTLTRQEAAHVLASLANALAYAHENGVLHLDIKPTNILIDRQGIVKLADFGMATLASAAGYGDARGGTVGYMPPEQIEGMLVDERSDVFSLAVVIWQALTGTDPFAATSAKESLDLIYKGPKEPVSKNIPELIGAPEESLLLAMAVDATNRTASVGELADDLLPALGSAEDGFHSLQRLVTQTEEDDTGEDASWEDRHLPITVRYPWAAAAFTRGLSAIVTVWALAQILPAIGAADQRFTLVGSLVGGVAAALWPPLGTGLAGASLVFALATTAPTPSSFPTAAVMAVALAAWWAAWGRMDHMATPALLMPWCVHSPVAGAALAAFGMDPLPAAGTAAFSWLMGNALVMAAGCGFSAQALVPGLQALLADLGTWVIVAAAAASAALASRVALRGSVASGIVGQVLGCALLIGGYVLAAWVENGGIWMAPPLGAAATAVLFSVFACILSALRGPLYEGQEGEETDELSQ